MGYSSVLIYPEYDKYNVNPLTLFSPFHPINPDRNFRNFYDVQEKLRVAPLPMPWPINRVGGNFTNPSTFITKYYLPIHILPHTKIVHTRDWNFVKAAIINKIPVIYERHYFQEKPFEPEIVKSSYFQVAVTQSEPIRESLIQYGMPPEKVVWLHNGFHNSFLVRKAAVAQAWRQQLLLNGRQHLVVYSGALYRFKGIDVLINAAKQLPQIQFVITGGTDEQVKAYQRLSQEKQVVNIKFLGWILPRKRLASLFQAADILEHPNCCGKSANFTNPVKFFQYMASGTPLVVTEIPPLMEFKNSPLIAGWCKPDNSNKLAECIQYVLAKFPRKIDGYAENINFASEFSWEKRAAKILSYVDDSYHPQVYN